MLQIEQKDRRRILIEAEAEHIESLRTEWTPFAITAVFRSEGQTPKPDRWLEEYRHKVLWKVNKQLYRHASKLIPIHELGCFYEFEESSLMKTLADKRRPHHVHATLLIPRRIINRIWSESDNDITHRLGKDFKSIKTVSSVLMKPIPYGECIKWFVYSAKGKSITNF